VLYSPPIQGVLYPCENCAPHCPYRGSPKVCRPSSPLLNSLPALPPIRHGSDQATAKIARKGSRDPGCSLLPATEAVNETESVKILWNAIVLGSLAMSVCCEENNSLASMSPRKHNCEEAWSKWLAGHKHPHINMSGVGVLTCVQGQVMVYFAIGENLEHGHREYILFPPITLRISWLDTCSGGHCT
jgi:hypothetical protein